MRLLVLGGTSFVGRAVVTAAVDRGWSVTTFNRGLGAWAHPAAERVTGDRLRRVDLERLRFGRWDVVVDTWAGAPRIVRDSAQLLSPHAGRYLLVSSRAVYAPPPPAGMDESCPTVDASPDADAIGYAQDKRGAEIAVECAFGDRALLARAGLILGPHEDVGRLPHWLLRIDRGGRVLAPGPADLPLQYVDVRDLATWLLGAAEQELSGPVNVVSPVAHCAMRDLLEAAVRVTCSDAELVWVDPAVIEAEGINRWTELPGWIPPHPQLAGLRSTNVERALATGLRVRPVEETVADTWAWLLASGGTLRSQPGRPQQGLDPAREQAVLDAWRRRTTR
jgi:nucleoside-diphosphate-sugar epimerase